MSQDITEDRMIPDEVQIAAMDTMARFGWPVVCVIKSGVTYWLVWSDVLNDLVLIHKGVAKC